MTTLPFSSSEVRLVRGDLGVQSVSARSVAEFCWLVRFWMPVFTAGVFGAADAVTAAI